MARTGGFSQVRGQLPQPLRYRIALASVVVVATLVKLWVAAHTYGTGDVRTWSHYAEGVAKAGPIGVYGLPFRTVYNHPPLIGYMLIAVNAATRHGLGFPFAIRIPAIAADVVTPFIVVGLLRRRRSALEAFAAAASVAASPVLLVISGFHGNTDPIFVMFTLLSVYLLVDQKAPALGGIAIALALSVKIIPFVVLPTLLVFAFLSGRRAFLRFAGTSSAFFAALWVPVVLREWQPFRKSVLGYEGGGRPWGLGQLMIWAGHPRWAVLFHGGGRLAVALLVASLPAIFVLRRPERVVEGSALALVGLLVLSPAYATQYTAWAVAAAYLISFWGATAYNLIAGGLLIEAYSRWVDGQPWRMAGAAPLTSGEAIVNFCAWMALLTVFIVGVVREVGYQQMQPAPASSDVPSLK